MRRVLISLAAALGAASAACSAPAGTEPARVEMLPDNFVLTEFAELLRDRFYRRPERLAFFGNVGPTAGCEELSKAISGIAKRDLRAFRPEYIAVAKAAVGRMGLSQVRQRELGLRLRHHSFLRERIDARLASGSAPTLDRAMQDLLGRLDRWTEGNGYAGRRLGYNRAGVAYWAANPAMPELVCATPPAARTSLLGTWQAQ